MRAIGGIVAAGVLVGGAGAGTSWTTISAHSPYDGCPGAGQEGLFADAEVEPSLAVDPRDPRRLVSAYQQDRFSNGAARGLAASYSEDGGATWSEAALPFSVCAGAATTGWPRASDPWVSIDGGGRIYVAGIGRGIAASTSTDGGRRWSAPTIVATNSAAYLLDKVAITADPRVPGVAYLVWERYLTRTPGPPIESDTLLSVTRDGGRHWSRPSVVLAHSKDAGAVASVILVDSRRQLFHLAYWQRGGFPGPGPGHLSLLLVQRSSNSGRTWTKPRRIARITTVGGQLRDPASGKIIRPGVPSFALDAARGDLYVAWQESRFSSGRVDQVAITRAGDRGQTWSKPRRVDVGSANLGIVPVVAADRGVAAVTYYSVAPARSGGNAQLTLAVSKDGAKSFRRRRPVGAAFDLADAPLLAGDPSILVPPGLFVGDYGGLAVQAGKVYMAFATANHDPANQTDIRFAGLPAS